MPGDGPVARAASALLRHESVIRRKDLLQRALEEAGLEGIGVDAVEAELAAFERDGRLIVLDKTELDPQRAGCWTTPGIAACEAALLRAAERLDERDWFTPAAVEQALAAAPHLSPEQVEAVRHAAGRNGVGIVEAGAGTGKTTMAQVVVSAAGFCGMSVLGLAPSWVAADELAASTGIPAQAIARWRHDLRRDHLRGPHYDPRHNRIAQGATLDHNTLVLIDEAGMVGTRDMEAILSTAKQAGAKVLLLGDRRQLASVAGASALRAVSEVVARSAVMEAVRRQLVDWQRAASVVMARGDAEAGLRAYAARGHVELVSGVQAAEARVIALWSEQRAAHGDDVLIVTRRNRDATSLNRRAREALRNEGRLGPDLVELPSLDRRDAKVALPLAVGDRIRFGETLPHLAIRNGNRATVQAIATDGIDGEVRLCLRLDDGREIEEPWQRLARDPRFGRKPAPPRITHGLAGTVHAAQSRTVSAAVLHIASPSDARELYVGLTRHRHDVRVVVERDRLDALCRQRQADIRNQPTTTAILERLFKEARHYSEKANVADYAEDRAAFTQTGDPIVREEESGLGVARASWAAKLLRKALNWLQRDEVVVPIHHLGIDRDHHLQQQKLALESASARLTGRLRSILAFATTTPERSTLPDHGHIKEGKAGYER